MTTPIDDLNPVPPQPELAEGNQVFHQKSYDLYVWMRTKLAPALEYIVSLLVNFVAGAYNASSTTSMALSLGAKTITVQPGMGYVPGNPIRVAYTTDATKYVDGVVTSYNSTTGALNFTATFLPSGVSGTFELWSISIIPSVGGLASLAANKFTGAQDFANAVSVASASTVNLNAMASNTGTLTGSTTITAWTLSNGATRRLLCPDDIQLTYNATTNNLNTGEANYTTQAGDILDITAYGSVIEVVITKQDGTAVTSPSLVTADNNATFNSTSDTQPTTPAWVRGVINAIFGARRFTTTEQTITSGSVIQIAHGLGAKPRYATAYLICKTAEQNFAVGNEIECPYVQGGGGSWGVTATVDATNIYLTVGASGVMLQNRSTGAALIITNTQWRMIGKVEL